MSSERNSQQQKVIDHKSGPLLVVAGAGTGKTRVIVDKILDLINQGVEPRSLLAVTFTEKAAAEMQERILANTTGFMAEMPITTYNGLGNELLREFSSSIGLPRNFNVLNPQAQIVFMRERLDEFGLDYFLPVAASPDGVLEDILKYFSKLKQNLIKPADYLSAAKALPATDEAEKLEKSKHKELAKAYQTYVNLCRDSNVIDYDDQIYLMVELLEQRPNIRKQLQQRYSTIFVDEFQDTNPMQSELIDLLVNDSQNIIAVGDDDQAIYGFRGATLQNILSFKERFPSTAQVALTQNYRSNQEILDMAYTLIQNNNPHRLETTLAINKRLTSDISIGASTLTKFDTTQAELDWLASDIKQRLQDTPSNKPVSIAVLTRSNPTAEAVHQALLAADIEHRVVGLRPSIYSQPIVRMLIELIKTLSDPTNNTSLHHTLTGPLYNIDPNVVAPLARKATAQHESLEEALVAQEDTSLSAAISSIRNVRSYAANASIGKVLWKVVNETGYKDALLEQAMKDQNAAASIGHLNQFFSSLQNFETIAGMPTIHNYLLSLPALMAAGENTEDDTLELSEQTVVVTTIHKAKGLEWDTVYIPKLTAQTFPLNRQAQGLQLPESLSSKTEATADDHYNEERRVMYVAMTRARHNLLLSFANKSDTGSAKRPSVFLQEIYGEEAIAAWPTNEIPGQSTSVINTAAESTSKIETPTYIYDGKEVRLSVSQAMTLLNCPRNFYYKFVLQTPEEPTTSTTYGTAIHACIEDIHKGLQNGQLRPLPDILKELEQGWRKAGYASLGQQQKAIEQACQTVSNFYHNAKESPIPTKVEEPFDFEVEPGLSLHGRIDAIYDYDDGVEIRDFKTGTSVNDEKKAVNKARASQQLTMYAMAWQKAHDELPKKVSLHYVDTNQLGRVGKTQKGIDGLQAKLSERAADLRQNKFPLGAQHDYCIHP